MMCGFCTPGLVMAVTSLLEANPKPTEEEIRHACSGISAAAAPIRMSSRRR